MPVYSQADLQATQPDSGKVPGVVAALDALLIEMEAFGNDKKEVKEDLDMKVDLLTDKLKEAFDPKTDLENFRWSLSDPTVSEYLM